MFSLFKSRITGEQAADILSKITQDVRSNYVRQVFPPEASLPDTRTVNEQLLFLAMYIIDGLIKNSTEKSWVANREIIAKQYYSKCAALAGKHVDSFMWLFFDQINSYNHGLSNYASEISKLQSRDDRLVALCPRVGELFAESCGVPQDSLHGLIGAGAFLVVSNSAQQLFAKSKIGIRSGSCK